jgi:DNA gyrase subunit A
VAEIRELGRATQGVTLINLGEGEKLSGLEKIVETDDTDAVVDISDEAGADAMPSNDTDTGADSASDAEAND